LSTMRLLLSGARYCRPRWPSTGPGLTCQPDQFATDAARVGDRSEPVDADHLLALGQGAAIDIDRNHSPIAGRPSDGSQRVGVIVVAMRDDACRGCLDRGN